MLSQMLYAQSKARTSRGRKLVVSQQCLTDLARGGGCVLPPAANDDATPKSRSGESGSTIDRKSPEVDYRIHRCVELKVGTGGEEEEACGRFTAHEGAGEGSGPPPSEGATGDS